MSIKNGGVSNTDITGTISANKIGTGITNAQLNVIAAANKVQVGSLKINGESSVASGAADADKMIIYDADGSGNKTLALSVLSSYVANGTASFANQHADLASEAPDDISITYSGTDSGIDVITSLTFDDYGHIQGATQAGLPLASGTHKGLVSTGSQVFAGAKTFENNMTIGGSGAGQGANLTVYGDLTVTGDTVSLEVATLNVEDDTIVAAVPSSAYDLTAEAALTAQANADFSGFLVASHHDSGGGDAVPTYQNKYAGVIWNDDANLTGWSVRDTATPHAPGNGEAYSQALDTAAEAFEIAVMEYDASNAPTDNGAGLGAFYFKEDTGDLYFRSA